MVVVETNSGAREMPIVPVRRNWGRFSWLPVRARESANEQADAAHDADLGPAEGLPELQALSHYLGTWDVVVTTGDSPFKRGTSTARWILGGKFLQQTGSIASADGKQTLETTTLMTYDQEEKRYRMWTFLSDGVPSEWSGNWDEQTRTMTTVRRGGGTVTTTTANFPGGGVEEWTMVVKNGDGGVVAELSGRNTRRGPHR